MQRHDIVTSSLSVVYLVQYIILETQISPCSLYSARTLLMTASLIHRFCRSELVTFLLCCAETLSAMGWACFGLVTVFVKLRLSISYCWRISGIFKC